MNNLKKSFGQHFLNDKKIAEKIVDSADFKSVDFVIEVGPGEGALTDFIGEKSKHQNPNIEIKLVEADKDLIENLKAKYPDAEVIKADAVQIDFYKITKNKKWLLIGNLPYSASSAIIMNALSSKNPPIELVVMTQKEQADRILGLPGSMGVLSVATGLYAKPQKLFNVKPGSFTPPPKVVSTVLKLKTPSKIDDLKKDQIESVVKLAKAGFSSRRKQLHRNLKDAGIADSDTTKKILEKLGYSPTARAEELSVSEWLKLANKLEIVN